VELEVKHFSGVAEQCGGGVNRLILVRKTLATKVAGGLSGGHASLGPKRVAREGSAATPLRTDRSAGGLRIGFGDRKSATQCGAGSQKFMQRQSVGRSAEVPLP